jgi:hypothetical protein
MTGGEDAPLSERLRDDFRAKLLGGAERMVFAREGVLIEDGFCYAGPFYCEAASSGEYSSTDCRAVLSAERRACSGADIFVAVFGESFSPGTVVELEWAIELNKDIIILYRECESRYSIGTEYWFPIADAIERAGGAILALPYRDEGEIADILRQKIKDFGSEI